jgi:curved DNA-binding protein CbpA
MKFIDYYELLQVSPTASFEVIRVAYRQLSKMYHPDVSNQDGEKFKLIKEAYDILSNESKRDKYDLQWRENQNKSKSMHRNEEIISDSRSTKKVGKGALQRATVIIIGILAAIFIIGVVLEMSVSEVVDSNSSYDDMYSISLPKEDYTKIKTTEYILDYGEAYFDIYNGTNLTIKSITVEINVKNDKGDIIDTRQFRKDVWIDPLTTEKEIHITTGIKGLPKVGENDLRIQPKYISWSYIEIIGDNLQ